MADTIQLYLKMTRLEKLYEKEKYQICENLKEDKRQNKEWKVFSWCRSTTTLEII